MATIQSLDKAMLKENTLSNAFGCVIIDECHHIPAETYRNSISKLNTHYLYGLTATPFRKYNDGKLLFIHIGEIIAEIAPQSIEQTSQAKIIIRNTTLNIPFNSKTDTTEILSKAIVHDSSRNKLIINDIKVELGKGRKVAVLTERKEHIEALSLFLKHHYEVISLSGDDSEAERKRKWAQLKAGDFQVLITTGQFFGEGSDIQNIECLFLVYPFSFEGKLIQYIGRVQRGDVAPTIYDYRDMQIDYLNRLFLKRNAYYRKLQRQHDLFSDQPEELPSKETNHIIRQEVKILFDDIDFRYGTISFKYHLKELNREIEFEIENLNSRPEFDVLKPYFIKTLGVSSINIQVEIEVEHGEIVSQLATSNDLEKINSEIIDSVKFRFVTKSIFQKQFTKSNEEELMTVENISDEANQVFQSGEELLAQALKNKDCKHYKQLIYLSNRHESKILKLRFVLSPFSFVFLLKSEKHFHIVLETYDTEEATYMWHLPDNDIKKSLLSIEDDLTMIRNEGRQHFLSRVKDNFSRVLHDYTDESKGFMQWKDQIEERLT